MSRFGARLTRLERGRFDPAACPGPATVLLFDDEEYVPKLSDRCRRCGAPHVRRIVEVVVDAQGGEIDPGSRLAGN